MSKALILIPARGGSKGIPGKNMAPVGGIPLIEFTIRAALESGIEGRICLSTDDIDIRNFGLSFPIEAPFLRPAELAQDYSVTVPVVLHALDWYFVQERFEPDYVVLLQPTCPFRSSKSIQDAYRLIGDVGADSLISVNRVSEHPCEYITFGNGTINFVMEPPQKPGRQNYPEVFFINGAIYITKTSFILRTGKLFDEKALIYLVSQDESLDIDMPEDLEYANWLFSKKGTKGV